MDGIDLEEIKTVLILVLNNEEMALLQLGKNERMIMLLRALMVVVLLVELS